MRTPSSGSRISLNVVKTHKTGKLTVGEHSTEEHDPTDSSYMFFGGRRGLRNGGSSGACLTTVEGIGIGSDRRFEAVLPALTGFPGRV